MTIVRSFLCALQLLWQLLDFSSLSEFDLLWKSACECRERMLSVSVASSRSQTQLSIARRRFTWSLFWPIQRSNQTRKWECTWWERGRIGCILSRLFDSFQRFWTERAYVWERSRYQGLRIWPDSQQELALHGILYFFTRRQVEHKCTYRQSQHCTLRIDDTWPGFGRSTRRWLGLKSRAGTSRVQLSSTWQQVRLIWRHP